MSPGRAGLAALILLGLGLPGLADARRAIPQAACAAYDLHLLMLVEDHGLTDETAPGALADAMAGMLAARGACRDGDHARALELYAAIRLPNVRVTPFYRVLLR
jgi:hypothetical protein